MVDGNKQKVSPERIFSNYRNYFAFCIEWQKVTGEILMTDDRTREQGKEKLEDAAIRETERNMLIEQGLI